MNDNNQSRALILSAAGSFRDAIVLGQGLPLEKNGLPVRYFWKEALVPGEYRDKRGTPFKIDGSRVDNLVRNFSRAKAKGFLPCVPDRHEKVGSKNFGFVVDARKNERGGLELLHQMIGDDAITATARNGSSICTVQNFTDETGETFDELIDHNAIVPDPQLSNLEDFKPALAASRGESATAIVLQLASSEQEPEMDLTKLREAIGAGKEQSDEQVLTAAVAKLGEGKTAADALQLSRTKIDGYDALLTRAETAERKVLELSRDPDPDVLADRADLMAQKIDLCLSRGQCTKQQADLMLGMLKDGDKPHALMLSRSGPSGTPIDAMLKVLELNQSLTGFQRTEGQPVARQTPGAGGEAKPITPERKQELLAMAGLPAK